MTRWHHDDIAGRILASPDAENWTLISLPALAGTNDPLGRNEGEALWPQRYDANDLTSKKRNLGARSFEALYQQRPTPEQGTILLRPWFNQRYREPPHNLRVTLAVDSAFQTGVGSDYTAIAAWATDEINFYLLDLWRGRVEFPDLITQIQAQAAKHQPQEILIENAASGQSAIQALRRDTNLPIIPIPAESSKESRLDAISGLFEAGKILLPENTPWLADWIEEHIAFPRAPHDDMVDTTSLALTRLRTDHSGIRILTAPQPPTTTIPALLTSILGTRFGKALCRSRWRRTGLSAGFIAPLRPCSSGGFLEL